MCIIQQNNECSSVFAEHSGISYSSRDPRKGHRSYQIDDTDNGRELDRPKSDQTYTIKTEKEVRKRTAITGRRSEDGSSPRFLRHRSKPETLARIQSAAFRRERRSPYQSATAFRGERRASHSNWQWFLGRRCSRDRAARRAVF